MIAMLVDSRSSISGTAIAAALAGVLACGVVNPSYAAVHEFTDGTDYTGTDNFPTDISFMDGANKLPDVPIPASADAGSGCNHTTPCFNRNSAGGKLNSLLVIDVPAADESWTTWAFSYTDKNGAVTYGSYRDRQHGYIASIPEPSAWTMMLAGFAGLGLVARWRSRGRASVSSA
jgi:hypothetical protein